jgi:SpoIID/LytB domain protein
MPTRQPHLHRRPGSSRSVWWLAGMLAVVLLAVPVSVMAADPGPAPTIAPTDAPPVEPTPSPSTVAGPSTLAGERPLVPTATLPPYPTPSATPSPTPIPPGPTVLGATVAFHGRGYGHGIGLSQYGAKGRAMAGQSATEILAHYFQGASAGTVPFDTPIRVRILRGFVATAAAPLEIRALGGPWTIDGVASAFPTGARLTVTPTTSGGTTTWRMRVTDAGGAVLRDASTSHFRMRPAGAATILQVWSRPSTYDEYRGVIRAVLASSEPSADVINELPLDTYLRGVVPAEMPASWPTEAVRAQTIAARSYAAYHLRPGVSYYDVNDDTSSQVYGGKEREHPTTDAAIAATAGVVLRSGSKIANTMFHSAGGGATEHNENVYVSSTGKQIVSPVSYLRGSSDRAPDGSPYDGDSPFATWQTMSYTRTQLSSWFAADPRTDVGALTALDLRDRGVSGRLISVTLIGSAGTKTVSGDVFRAVFNARRPSGDPMMRSSLTDTVPIP